MYPLKRLTILCGHYGSGKTNVAVNVATELKKTRDTVTVADLDIVNPYFRTKDSAAYFEEQGIRLICSAYANSNVDIPALPQEMYAITDDRSMTAVLDIGGDDRGALVLGRLAPKIIAEDDYGKRKNKNSHVIRHSLKGQGHFSGYHRARRRREGMLD